MCIAHLYGVTLYFATEYRNEKMTGDSASLPGFLYYWVFYFGFNAVWAVVPACESSRPNRVPWTPKHSPQKLVDSILGLLHDSWAAITSAIQMKDAQEVRRKAY